MPSHDSPPSRIATSRATSLLPGLSGLLIGGLLAGCSTPAAKKQMEPAESSVQAPIADPTPQSAELVLVPNTLAGGLELVAIHRGLSKPLALEFFAGDPLRRLFVVEQTGTIRAIQDGKVSRQPLIDLASRISRNHTEQGLLGLAFHPDFKTNGRLFVTYTNQKSATQVVEYQTRGQGGQGAIADLKSERVLVTVDQPWRNHNGGGIEFGPDGMLYIGMGDGGAANDPKRVGQDPNSQLGKMLRINVDAPVPDRLVVETIQSGLRNPWRYSFDPQNGDLYIADVGQDKWEEVHVVAAKDIVGANLGWSVMEGNHCLDSAKDCDSTGMIPAAIEYDHVTGCSITGGHVYRGKAIPQLDGAYFYADFCTAILRSFRWFEGTVSDHWDWKEALDPQFRLAQLSSFGEDEYGELYLLSSGGVIYKLQPKVDAN